MSSAAQMFTLQLDSAAAQDLGNGQYRTALYPPLKVPYMAKPTAMVRDVTFTNSMLNVDNRLYKNDVVKLAWVADTTKPTEISTADLTIPSVVHVSEIVVNCAASPRAYCRCRGADASRPAVRASRHPPVRAPRFRGLHLPVAFLLVRAGVWQPRCVVFCVCLAVTGHHHSLKLTLKMQRSRPNHLSSTEKRNCVVSSASW